jgi:colanic acid biosynthesis glycosyl transferase WcaI
MLSDLVFGLAKRGTQITVITSRLRYDAPEKRLASREVTDGVHIVRIWTSRFGRTFLPFRAIDYLTFYLTAVLALLSGLKPGDVVVAMTDPPMMSVIAKPIANLRGARLVNWMQDIFPEIAESLDVGGRVGFVLFAPMRWMRNASLRGAHTNVTIGERMAEKLGAVGVEPSRICVVPNWADCDAITPIAPDDNPLRRDWKLNGTFTVGYSGNLGRAHEIETLLQAITAIESNVHKVQLDVPIRWLFIGGGALFQSMQWEVAKRKLNSVAFRPYQARENLSQSLSVADVHLVSLRPELEGLIVPSKFYGIAAVGRPTIFIGAPTGEIATQIARYGCGVCVASGDGNRVAEAVIALARDEVSRQVMGRRAREMCEELYSKRRAIDNWYGVLRGVSDRDSERKF